jgi:hypothetical protein
MSNRLCEPTALALDFLFILDGALDLAHQIPR